MATSASERIEKIRALLATADVAGRYVQGTPGAQALQILQEFVDQAAEPATVDTIVEEYIQSRIREENLTGVHDSAWNAARTEARKLILAGEQMALESWEPDDRAPEPHIAVDMTATRVSFDLENGFTIEFDDGRTIALDATRTDLLISIDEATQEPVSYTDAVAAGRHRMEGLIDAALVKINERKATS